METVLKMAEEKLSQKTGVSSYQMFQLHGAAKKMRSIARENAAAQVWFEYTEEVGPNSESPNSNLWRWVTYVHSPGNERHMTKTQIIVIAFPSPGSRPLYRPGVLQARKSQGVRRWAPTATRSIAYAPNFPFFPFDHYSESHINYFASPNSNFWKWTNLNHFHPIRH